MEIFRQVTVYFEGLGLPRFTFSKIAFTLFDRWEITWAMLITLAAVLIGTVLALRAAKRHARIAMTDTLEVILCGFLGARLLPMLRDLGLFSEISWGVELELWGSILLTVLFVYVACRFLRIRMAQLADAVAPVLLLGFAIGAWSMLFSGNTDSAWLREHTAFCLFGKTISLPTGEGTVWWVLRMGIYPNALFPNSAGEAYMIFAHPLFLYASLWCLLGFGFLLLLHRKKLFDGQVFLIGLIWFCAGCTFLTGLSTAATALELQWGAAIGVCLTTARLIVDLIAYRAAKHRLDAGLLVIVKGDSTV